MHEAHHPKRRNGPGRPEPDRYSSVKNASEEEKAAWIGQRPPTRGETILISVVTSIIAWAAQGFLQSVGQYLINHIVIGWKW